MQKESYLLMSSALSEYATNIGHYAQVLKTADDHCMNTLQDDVAKALNQRAQVIIEKMLHESKKAQEMSDKLYEISLRF